jgi:hypothetical protein
VCSWLEARLAGCRQALEDSPDRWHLAPDGASLIFHPPALQLDPGSLFRPHLNKTKPPTLPSRLPREVSDLRNLRRALSAQKEDEKALAEREALVADVLEGRDALEAARLTAATVDALAESILIAIRGLSAVTPAIMAEAAEAAVEALISPQVTSALSPAREAVCQGFLGQQLLLARGSVLALCGERDALARQCHETRREIANLEGQAACEESEQWRRQPGMSEDDREDYLDSMDDTVAQERIQLRVLEDELAARAAEAAQAEALVTHMRLALARAFGSPVAPPAEPLFSGLDFRLLSAKQEEARRLPPAAPPPALAAAECGHLSPIPRLPVPPE